MDIDHASQALGGSEQTSSSSSPAWEQFKREEHQPGFCVAGCERRISPPKRFLCGDKECKRLFHSIYRRGLRHRAKALAGAPLVERTDLH